MSRKIVSTKWYMEQKLDYSDSWAKASLTSPDLDKVRACRDDAAVFGKRVRIIRVSRLAPYIELKPWAFYDDAWHTDDCEGGHGDSAKIMVVVQRHHNLKGFWEWRVGTIFSEVAFGNPDGAKSGAERQLLLMGFKVRGSKTTTARSVMRPEENTPVGHKLISLDADVLKAHQRITAVEDRLRLIEDAYDRHVEQHVEQS